MNKITNIQLGTIDEFHSPKCYELYLYAVGLAKQVNEYIDKGYIVFDGNDLFKNKFVFYCMNTPCIAEKSDYISFVYFGSSFDNDGKVWLSGIETKSTIKKRFEMFKFVKPSNIERMTF